MMRLSLLLLFATRHRREFWANVLERDGGRVLSFNQLFLRWRSSTRRRRCINPLRVDRRAGAVQNRPRHHHHRLFMLVATLVCRRSPDTLGRGGSGESGSPCRTRWQHVCGWPSRSRNRSASATGSPSGPRGEITGDVRATKLRTKANLVVLPNAFISKEAIVNYSEPEAPTRLEITVASVTMSLRTA